MMVDLCMFVLFLVVLVHPVILYTTTDGWIISFKSAMNVWEKPIINNSDREDNSSSKEEEES